MGSARVSTTQMVSVMVAPLASGLPVASNQTSRFPPVQVNVLVA